ncbi:hypothetical protein C2G38_2190717 [Gigaspora rosea]|uniref:Uncharacterized protein n=1 Tax=Gigaspora rosea TaxID=44941 RepID=A0A397V2N6_9GLOM|nr:hypothetical protein C2G38_2190717 [Gigaspora rosea]
MCDNTKLKEQSFNISPMFHEFLGCANPEAYKGARKQFNINKLNLHCQLLIPFLKSSWMRPLILDGPVRSIEKATSINIYENNNWINSYNKMKYRKLENILKDLLPWKPINLEKHLPTEPVQPPLSMYSVITLSNSD